MNRKVFFGCGGVAAFFAAALVALVFFWAPRLFQKGKGWVATQMAEAQRISAFEQSWQPPSDAPDAQWFPPAVGAWQRGSTSIEPGLPELKIEREAHRASYKNGTDEITVAVVAANDLEKEAIFARAKDALLNEGSTRVTSSSGNVTYSGSSSGSHFTTSTGNRLYVRTNGVNHTRLWWLRGWLFVFRTHGSTDPETFMQQYLAAMQKPQLERR
jgi:hypothetical protein